MLLLLRLSELERGLLVNSNSVPLKADPAFERIEFLTGLTGLSPFPVSFHEPDFEAGQNKLTHP
jgi:hypothetical protein